MTDAPKRIFLEPMHDFHLDSFYEWCWIEYPETEYAVEYIRADLVSPPQEESDAEA